MAWTATEVPSTTDVARTQYRTQAPGIRVWIATSTACRGSGADQNSGSVRQVPGTCHFSTGYFGGRSSKCHPQPCSARQPHDSPLDRRTDVRVVRHERRAIEIRVVEQRCELRRGGDAE